MGRTILAVVVGFVVWSVLWQVFTWTTMSVSADAFVDGATDSVGVLLMLLVMAIVTSVVSGFVTASLARDRAMKPVRILGVLLLAVGIAVQMAFWSTVPVWYHLMFLASLYPCTVLGGRIRQERSATPTVT